MHEIGVAVMAVKVVAFVGVMVFSLAAAGVWLGVWQARSAASFPRCFNRRRAARWFYLPESRAREEGLERGGGAGECVGSGGEQLVF